ncbi:class I SAM-dependent methyltransferase, partial [Pandoraea nosoerga]|uniref:class I SAM-dependent methyltransferase n=1 Tax=Pandoraea nosoerga TaxID=2508296 RepID=UPI00197E57C0
NNIAGRYDFLKRLLSAGIDINWRKKAIKELASLQPKIILDVATGTADVALLTQKMLKPAKIIGIDISAGMLEIGRKKIATANLQETIALTEADSATIPFTDNYFDAITVAFGVRNFQHLEKGIAEMYRVL